MGGLGAAGVEALTPEFDLEVSATEPAAQEALNRAEIAVAVMGPELPGEAASTFLADAKQRHPALATRFIVLAAGSNLSFFQDFVDDDTVFFLTESPVGPAELLAIVRSAATSWERSVHGTEDTGLESTKQISRLRRILDLAHSLAVQNEMTAIAELAKGGV